MEEVLVLMSYFSSTRVHFPQVLPEMFCCWIFNYPGNMFVLPIQPVFQTISGVRMITYHLTFSQLKSISSRVSGQYQDVIN